MQEFLHGLPEGIKQIIARVRCRRHRRHGQDGVPVNISVSAPVPSTRLLRPLLSRAVLIPTGFDISCAPVFSDILINGESRTAIRLSIYVHQINRAAMDNVVMDDVKPVA